jgi:hypothetical protein
MSLTGYQMNPHGDGILPFIIGLQLLKIAILINIIALAFVVKIHFTKHRDRSKNEIIFISLSLITLIVVLFV